MTVGMEWVAVALIGFAAALAFLHVDAKLRRRFAEIDAKLRDDLSRARIDSLVARMDARSARIDARLDSLEARFGAHLDRHMS